MALTVRQRAILDCEREWWIEPGSKEQAIRRAVGLSSRRYYTLLAGLVDSTEAYDYDPLVVLRLRRDREIRRRARWEGRPAGDPR